MTEVQIDRQRRRDTVLQALAQRDMTAAEFAEDVQDDHVLMWAPEFTHLKQAGLIEWTGEKRRTSRGGEANVHRLTDAGRARVEALG